MREKAVFELLKLITAPIIVAEGKSEHFVDIFDDFTEEELSFLAEIVFEIPDPELKARITDILWIKKYPKNNYYQMAKLAINAYMESAKNLESAGLLNNKDIEYLFMLCFEKIERAFYLGYKIKDESVQTKTFKQIELLIERYYQENSSCLAGNLMSLLLEKKLGNPIKYSTLVEKIAMSAEANSDWYGARGYWELKAKWHKLEKNKQKEFATLILAAETYVKDSEDYIKKEPKSYLGASTSMEEAYVAFRNIPDKKAKLRAEQCHKLLLEYQEKAYQEIVSTGIRYDLTQVIPYEQCEKEARESVKGKDFQTALFAIAKLINIQKTSDLRATVEKCLKDDLSPFIIPCNMINEKGKTIAKKTGIDLNNKEGVEDSIKFKMNQDASWIYDIHAKTLIEPARDQITLEHEIRVEDLRSLVKDKPFVPSGREYLFAKGLYAGFIGDFFTSTHFLIPQIENSVRHLLKQRGAITSGLDDQGIQNEHNLNKILYESKYPEIKTIFDEDILFNLKCLLVEHSGCNLRNRMAHGLIDDREFQPGVMSYLWWLTLRLCCLPMLNYREELEKSNSLLQFAGMFEDDPSFDEFVEAMANNRQQSEIEMANSQDEEISAA